MNVLCAKTKSHPPQIPQHRRNGHIKIMLSHTAETHSQRETAAEPRPLPLLISRCLFIGLHTAIVKDLVTTNPQTQSVVLSLLHYPLCLFSLWTIITFILFLIKFLVCHMWPHIYLCLFTKPQAWVLNKEILQNTCVTALHEYGVIAVM